MPTTARAITMRRRELVVARLGDAVASTVEFLVDELPADVLARTGPDERRLR